MKQLRWDMLSIVITFCLPTIVHAQPSYQFTPIDVPGSSGTQANGLNAAGDIVGDYYLGAAPHGFLMSGGNYTTIDVPGASATIPQAINASGQIVGYTLDSLGAK